MMSLTARKVGTFLLCLALGVTANCICEIHCLAVDGFNLHNVHKLSSKEKIFGQSGAAGWEARMVPLCHAGHP